MSEKQILDLFELGQRRAIRHRRMMVATALLAGVALGFMLALLTLHKMVI